MPNLPYTKCCEMRCLIHGILRNKEAETAEYYEISFKLIYLFISVYLSSLLVAHLSDAPRRRLVVTEDSVRIQAEVV